MKGSLGVLILNFLLIVPVFTSPFDAEKVGVVKNFKGDEVTKPIQPRWEMIPDGSGKMHLIDMNSYEVSEVEPFFNAANDVFFMLYTRRNPTTGQRLSLDVDVINNSEFDVNSPTRFVIHGWNNEHTSDVNVQITAGYLGRGEFNVIIVDWGAGANTLDYITARNRINDVGVVVANFVDYLVSHGFVSLSELSVIGHSLGGHTAGLTGKGVTTGRIQSIIALDPAGPLFSLGSPNERVTETDGNYVEIIHTNGGTLGFRDPIGHADFYPNGGSSQPGCGIDLVGSCAHSRAYAFFAESVQAVNGFAANRCATFSEANNNRCTIQSSGHLMGGEPPNHDLRGYFHLQTNSASPFARG